MMVNTAEDVIRAIFDGTISAHQAFAARALPEVVKAAEVMASALATGRKVIAFGNGGSAGDAEHLAAELVGRFEVERAGLPAIALTADSSVMTAIANDYGYATVFSRQIDALGVSGDVAFGISTSGRSANVEAGLTAARARGLTTIALTGRDGGKMGTEADVHVNVSEQSTARVQEVHRTIIHGICAIIDRKQAGRTAIR